VVLVVRGRGGVASLPQFLFRLCAAAFVQDRKAFTGCTDAATPTGISGREWCYVEAQASFWLEALAPAVMIVLFLG